jgi:hypothetical protein
LEDWDFLNNNKFKNSLPKRNQFKLKFKLLQKVVLIMSILLVKEDLEKFGK